MAPPDVQDIDRSRIVVVDDNEPSAELVQAVLGRAGMLSVVPLSDPRVLFERYDELSPQLVVLDLHMPGIDGYTMLAELRGRAPVADLPILVLTADTTRDATHRALSLGASDFLTKPIDATELVLRVRNMLAGRAAHEGLLQRHQWLEASAELAGDLLSGRSTNPLRRLCELARAAADADGAMIIGPAAALQAKSTTSAGALPPAAVDSVTAAFADGRLTTQSPAILDTLGGPRDPAGAATGPLMVVPLGTRRKFGALVLVRSPGRAAFSETEHALATGFADQAAVGVELAEAQAEQERMLVQDDRHRIARDLHDHVIQRLFAAGLRLQQISEPVEPGALADGIREHLEDLDDTIDEIRSTVFGLRQAKLGAPAELVNHLEALSQELAGVLGFAPQVVVDAPSAHAVDVEIADDLVAAAREALTNVARHAHARHVEVSVRITEQEIVLEVLDDGVGIADAHRYSGLMNLSERARRHDGTCRVSPAAGGGTRLQWRAPLCGALHAPAQSGGGRRPARGEARVAARPAPSPRPAAHK